MAVACVTCAALAVAQDQQPEALHGRQASTSNGPSSQSRWKLNQCNGTREHMTMTICVIITMVLHGGGLFGMGIFRSAPIRQGVGCMT